MFGGERGGGHVARHIRPALDPCKYMENTLDPLSNGFNMTIGKNGVTINDYKSRVIAIFYGSK